MMTATLYRPSMSLYGSHSLSAAILLTILILASKIPTRHRRLLIGTGPALLFFWVIALILTWSRFTDAQHYVAEVICLAGVVGLGLAIVRREKCALRLWGGVWLAVGLLLVVHIGVGIRGRSGSFFAPETLMGLLLGGLAAVSVTWAFWLCWAFSAQSFRHGRTSTTWPPGRWPIMIICVFWIVVAAVDALVLASRWHRQRPVMQMLTSYQDFVYFKDADGLERLLPPPIRELKPMEDVEIYRAMSDADVAVLANVESLESVRLMDASELTDDGLRQLTRLRRLRYLWIYNAHLTPEGIEALEKALPGVSLYCSSK